MADEHDELVEKIKIFATDDEKIKSFGEMFTNDSSREILQLLFNDEMTATQISQKTEISLQLVKYHLNKLLDLGIVKISKIEKNSKSHDMKVYTAIKFSIVIVPPKLSEKTRESKLLVRSFRHIYKVAGLGIATGFSGMLTLLELQQKPNISNGIQPTLEKPVVESSPVFTSEDQRLVDQSFESESFQDPALTDKSTAEFAGKVDEESTAEFAGKMIDMSNPDYFLLLISATIILGGLTIFYLIKQLKG